LGSRWLWTKAVCSRGSDAFVNSYAHAAVVGEQGMIHRLHGFICGAMHRAALHNAVVAECESILHCHWIDPPPARGELSWCELDEHNGEVELWSDHDETLVSMSVHSHFTINDKLVRPEQLERLLAAAIAARLHKSLWGMVLRGRRSLKYVVDCGGHLGDDTEGAAYEDARTRVWLDSDTCRSGAITAVGEDEYVRAFMESYRRRRVNGHHKKPPEEVEAKLRADYRNSLAKYEGYRPDLESLLFVV